MKNKILLNLATIALLSTQTFANNTEEIKLLKAQVNELQKYIEEVEENLESTETKILVDKIKLGLGMRVEANNFQTTYANGSHPLNKGTIYRTKLNINMKSKIANNLKFSGRLSSYKNWGDSNTDTNAGASMDSRQGRTPDSDSSLFVERAYLDWSLNTNSDYPMVLTVGRHPSSDGPSYQIKEGTTRKGTYDALAFDGATDGILFTSNLDKALPGTTSLRIGYAIPNNGSTYNDNMKDTKVRVLFIDKTCEKISYKHLFQFYTVKSKDLVANPDLETEDKNVGDLDISGAMFEINDISGFDLFAHYSYSIAKPNGELVDLGTLGSQGLLTSTQGDTEEKSGHAIWLGAKYNMNKVWSIGAEYNKGSKNWFSYTLSPNDSINKLATRGTAIELYISKKINKHANVRLGYIDIDYDYTGSGNWIGEPEKITSALGTDNIKEKTNLYLTLNVLF